MANGDKRENLRTPLFRLSFPNLFEPRAAKAGQKAKYSCSMIFTKGDPGLEPIKAAVLAAGRAKFQNFDALLKLGREQGRVIMKLPWHDGLEKAGYAGYGEGTEYANASSLRQPGVVDRYAKRITDPSLVYAGCYAWATINVFAYENEGKGVSLGLQNIQIVRDGERIDGAIAPEHEFDAVEDDPEGAVDPLG